MARSLIELARLLKPRRRWAQFSLGTMFLVVTALCVWLARHVEAVNRQRAAVAAIEQLGGSCFYDGPSDDENPFLKGGGDQSGWLRRCLGVDHFANVVEAEFYTSGQLSRALPHLRDVPNLTKLTISLEEDRLTEKDVEIIRSIIGLRELTLITSPDFNVAAVQCLLPGLEVRRADRIICVLPPG